MRCPTCRKAELSVTRKPHRYTESGLRNVVLRDVEFRDCPECGESLLGIHNLEGLHRTIARALLTKPEQLAPEEIVFLRKSLGWSQADFARHMHAKASTVNRWEKGTQVMGDKSDLLLRAFVALGRRIEDYDIDDMDKRAVKGPEPLHLTLQEGRGGWKSAA